MNTCINEGCNNVEFYRAYIRNDKPYYFRKCKKCYNKHNYGLRRKLKVLGFQALPEQTRNNILIDLKTLTLTEVAKSNGINPPTLSRWLKKMGIPVNRKRRLP